MQLRTISAIVGAFMAFSLTAFAPPSTAHHSHANYVETDWTMLEGTVTAVHWINPHTWIYMQVASRDGNDGAWALEGASVTSLRKKGWTQESLVAGDQISVRCHPLKDGSRGCLLGFITKSGEPEKEFD